MDMKTQIQNQVNQLIRDSSFLENSPRYRKFLITLCTLIDIHGRIPSASIIGKHLSINKSSVDHMRQMLRERGLWPFPERRYRMRLEPSSVSFEYDASLHDQRYKEDMARVAAARKAKRAKMGETLKNEDIDSYL
jgi:hypothetical protein